MWVPQVTPPTVQTQVAYQPNYVTQQVAQTSYMPQVYQTQRPVQVTRMQTEAVTQQVPVQQTTYEPVVETRKIPITVQRPVTEYVTQKVPVTQTRYVTEVAVRRVPVTTQRIVYETESRQEPVQVCKMQTEVRRVQVPKTVQRLEPYEVTVTIPRTVVQRIPVNYFDPYGPAISQHGYSSSCAPVTPIPAAAGPAPTEPTPAEEPNKSLKPGEGGVKLESKAVEPTPDPNADGASPSDKSKEPSDNDKINPPEINLNSPGGAKAAYRGRSV